MATLKEGQKAPAFSVHDQDGHGVKLADLKGKWVVLYFYPRDNTPGCTVEAIDFTNLKKEFDKLGAVILGGSKDSAKSHCKFIEKQNLSITLLVDEDHALQEKYGVWRPKKFMGREFMGTVRSTFLIDPAGKIARIWDPVKAKGHAQIVLSTLQELA
jgi:peroxiredoxin Q/BCP